MADFETLTLERRGAALLITINRPKALNALNGKVVSELSHAFNDIESQSDISGVVLTGAGDKAFVAGADIREMTDMNETEALAFASAGHAVGEAVAHLPVPVIAAVHGFALGGGCELALACDFIYASQKAKFGQPEVKLGVIPGFGGTQRLLRRIGPAMAMELCLTGEMIDAARALDLGLVNRVYPQEELLEQALRTIETISKYGPLAIAAVKRVIHEGAQLPLNAANQLEVEAFAKLFNSEDQKEGMSAFAEKRPPKFCGK